MYLLIHILLFITGILIRFPQSMTGRLIMPSFFFAMVFIQHTILAKALKIKK